MSLVPDASLLKSLGSYRLMGSIQCTSKGLDPMILVPHGLCELSNKYKPIFALGLEP